MVTVCIFFGSGGGPCGAAAALAGGLGCAGAVATGAAIAGAEAQAGLDEGRDAGAVTGAADATTDGGKAALWLLLTGIVEMILGAGFGGSMLIGSSSRETTFSATDAVAVPPWPELAAWGSPELGMSLLGEVFALMTGGSAGSRDPPNVVREAKARAVPTPAKPSTAMTITNPPRRRG